MSKTLEKDGFQVEITPKGLNISGVNFSPSESTKILSILGWASRMSSMEVLPPSVAHDPFVIKFNEDGNHTMSRVGSTGEIVFRFSQLDNLVTIINLGIDSYKNNQDIQRALKLIPKDRVGVIGLNSPDIIEGRS